MAKVICKKDWCPLKNKCSRFTMDIKPMQSVGAFLGCNSESNYKNFWAIGSDKPKNPSPQVNGEYL